MPSHCYGLYNYVVFITDSMINFHNRLPSHLSWCLYLLATNAEKQEKLRSEVTSVLGSERMVTPKHIHDMQYLRHCIKETLRCVCLFSPHPHTLQLGTYTLPLAQAISNCWNQSSKDSSRTSTVRIQNSCRGKIPLYMFRT